MTNSSSPSRHRRRWTAQAAACTVPVLLFALAGCSGSAPRSSTSADAPVTTVVTPNVRPSDSAAPRTTFAQPQVSSAVIETPPGLTASTLPRPSLLDDYIPAPTNESTVLEVLSPDITVYQTATGYDVKTVLNNPLPSGSPLTFLVDGQTTNRYKVLLPIRPNGSTGWVDPTSVKKYVHDYKIVVELSAFRLTVYKGKEIALTEKIGVGTDQLPTPNGRYYLKELLKAPNPNGIYGPYAYGLSGFSQQLKKWNGGDGVIGIHGTNQPELLGRNISHGCIRMSNAGITKLVSFLPLGTPVIVQP